jgi:hypothetical protein
MVIQCPQKANDFYQFDLKIQIGNFTSDTHSKTANIKYFQVHLCPRKEANRNLICDFITNLIYKNFKRNIHLVTQALYF